MDFSENVSFKLSLVEGFVDYFGLGMGGGRLEREVELADQSLHLRWRKAVLWLLYFSKAVAVMAVKL